MEVRKILIASAGMVFTNGKDIGKEILLAEHDSPENWNEIPESEAAAMFNIEFA